MWNLLLFSQKVFKVLRLTSDISKAWKNWIEEVPILNQLEEGLWKHLSAALAKNVLRIRFLPLKLTKLDHLKSIRTRCLRNSWLNQWLVIVISLGSEAYLNQPRMHTGPEKSVSKPERGGFHHTSGLDSLSTKTTSSQSGRFSHLFFRPFFGPFIKAFFF